MLRKRINGAERHRDKELRRSHKAGAAHMHRRRQQRWLQLMHSHLHPTYNNQPTNQPHFRLNKPSQTHTVQHTCRSFGTMPASTAARDAPTAPPSKSAITSSCLKPSADLSARPPDTTTDAEPSSGRSALASWAPAYRAAKGFEGVFSMLCSEVCIM